MLSAGEFNSRIQILTQTEGQDEAGQPLGQWIVHDEVWAKALSLNGVQTIRAGAEAKTVKVSFRVRYREDLTDAMRVKDGGNVLTILALLPDRAKKSYLDLVCEVTK